MSRDFVKENLEPVSIYITQKQYDLTIHVCTREFPYYFFGNAENNSRFDSTKSPLPNLEPVSIYIT